MRQFLKTKWESLVFRLLFYFLLSMLAIAIIIGSSFTNRFKPHLRHDILPNLHKYVDYLVEDIGVPPDLQIAQQLADSLPFEIRIQGQGIDWASNSAVKPISSIDFKAAPPEFAGVYLGRNPSRGGHRRFAYLLIERQAFQFMFVLDNRFDEEDERRHWLLFLLLGSVLLLLYLAIRHMFRPVQALALQVKKIGEGDLEAGLESNARGELALLADGITRMSGQIKSMLEGKSSMLLAISHELRSPITRMRLNLELLEDSATRVKLIDDIREVESLLAAILESERLSSGHLPLTLESCDLDKLIETRLHGHVCAHRIETNLMPVRQDVDPFRFGLIIKNLVDNACQHSTQGVIRVSLQATPAGVEVCVKDQGEGIDARLIPRLTEAFYRPDSARQRETGGYGLGLYICKLIVDNHGGKMIIESELGKGTSVCISLPRDNS